MREAEQEKGIDQGEMNFEEIQLKRDGLSETHIMAYSLGHFGNDLCASMWFIYLTYYLQYVVHLSSTLSATA